MTRKPENIDLLNDAVVLAAEMGNRQLDYIFDSFPNPAGEIDANRENPSPLDDHIYRMGRGL